MLEQMRKSSQSLLIYVLFGIVIAVFIINFGPHAGEGCEGRKADASHAARVDGREISAQDFRYGYLLAGGSQYSAQMARQRRLKETIMDKQAFDRGMNIRREVLGDAHVDRSMASADEFNRPLQELITQYCWGEIWSRPGLDRKTRSAITLTALVALNHHEELAMHVRAALRNGLTPDEIKEVLLHAAIYCGVPAANRAFAIAQQVLAES